MVLWLERFGVFNLRRQDPMTSGVLTVLISGSRSSGWVAHSFARERTDQEDPRTAAQEIQHDSARTRVSPQTLYPIKIEFHFFCGNTTSLYIDLKEMFICTKISNANAIKFVLLTFLTFNRCSPWNRGILPQRWSIFGFSVNSCEYHNLLHCWFFVSSTNARRGGVCVSENYDKPVINLFGYRSKANVYLQISVTLRRGFILFYTGMLCTVWH